MGGRRSCLLENVYYHYFGLKEAICYTNSSIFHQNLNPSGQSMQKSQSWKLGMGQTDGLKKITVAKDMFYPHSLVSDSPKNAKKQKKIILGLTVPPNPQLCVAHFALRFPFLLFRCHSHAW